MARKRDPSAGRLTPKRKLFCAEYIIDNNGTQSAIRAGYPAKNASRIAHELLQIKTVQEAIQKEMDARAKRTHITADRVLMELAKCGFANLDDFVTINEDGIPSFDFSTVDRDKMAALSEITHDSIWEGKGRGAQEVKRIKIKFHDKVRSLQLLGNHLGIFRENAGADDAPMPVKVEITVVDGRKS